MGGIGNDRRTDDACFALDADSRWLIPCKYIAIARSRDDPSGARIACNVIGTGVDAFRIDVSMINSTRAQVIGVQPRAGSEYDVAVLRQRNAFQRADNLLELAS